MAELPAQPSAQITYTDTHLDNLQKSVAGSLQNAGVPVAYEAVKPVHVPDQPAENIVDQAKIDMENRIPGSFKSTPETALSPLSALSEQLNYADQLVTGRSHVVGEAQHFTAQRAEKEDRKMQFTNEPQKDNRGPVQKFVDWLHD